MKTAAILLAAGRSRRLGFDKILTPLAGKPALHYALKTFGTSPLVDELVLVTREDLIETMQEHLDEVESEKPRRVIQGGAERQDSVLNGLRALADDVDYVMIHDAARPFVAEEVIGRVLKGAEETGAAVCAQRATDTLKRADLEGSVQATVDRSSIWMVQTPQTFRRELVLEAYEKVSAEGIAVTDDASAVEVMGHSVQLIECTEMNFKLTKTADWELATCWLQRERGEGIRQELHELNNQMTPLLGYLPLVRKYGSSDSKFLDYLQKFQDSVDGMKQRLNSLHARVREMFPDASHKEDEPKS